MGLFCICWFNYFYFNALQIVSAVLGSIGLSNFTSGGEGIVVRVNSAFHMFIFMGVIVTF